MKTSPAVPHRKRSRVIVAFAAGRIETTAADPGQRADLLTVLGCTSSMAFPRLKVFTVIARQKMENSPFYRLIVTEGEIKRGRTALLSVIEARFGKRSVTGMKKYVQKIEDLKLLDTLLRLAARSDSINDVRNALAKE